MERSSPKFALMVWMAWQRSLRLLGAGSRNHITIQYRCGSCCYPSQQTSKGCYYEKMGLHRRPVGIGMDHLSAGISSAERSEHPPLKPIGVSDVTENH